MLLTVLCSSLATSVCSPVVGFITDSMVLSAMILRLSAMVCQVGSGRNLAILGLLGDVANVLVDELGEHFLTEGLPAPSIHAFHSSLISGAKCARCWPHRAKGSRLGTAPASGPAARCGCSRRPRSGRSESRR